MATRVDGVRISHPDKVWWPDDGITKLHWHGVGFSDRSRGTSRAIACNGTRDNSQEVDTATSRRRRQAR
jgi:hypothetical protein